MLAGRKPGFGLVTDRLDAGHLDILVKPGCGSTRAMRLRRRIGGKGTRGERGSICLLEQEGWTGAVSPHGSGQRRGATARLQMPRRRPSPG